MIDLETVPGGGSAHVGRTEVLQDRQPDAVGRLGSAFLGISPESLGDRCHRRARDPVDGPGPVHGRNPGHPPGIAGHRSRQLDRCRFAGDRLGGGHSHCGGMIYLGDNWPKRYRNTIFMCNTHGNRVNNDRIEWMDTPKAAGYVGRHGPDFLMGNDSWFRGVTINYGPDGAVFLSDWSDLGECHDREGVHRSSGRIYKISHGEPRDLPAFDLANHTNEKLVQLQLHRNDWYVRQARKLLQARAAEGRDMSPAAQSLRKMFGRETEVAQNLRILWALHAIGATPAKWLANLVNSEEPHLRVWAIRLLVEIEADAEETSQVLAGRADEDQSQLVLLQIASSLQSMPLERRLPVARSLVDRLDDARHRTLSLLTWYALEPLVAARPKVATELITKTTSPLLRRSIVRRLSEGN